MPPPLSQPYSVATIVCTIHLTRDGQRVVLPTNLKKKCHSLGANKRRNNSDAESTASGIGSLTGRTCGKDSDPRGNDYGAEE